MTAIIIVFNTDRFLTEQIRLLRKYVTEKIAVIDNSNDFEIATEIKAICDENQVDYTKTAVNEADFSRSHAFACEVAIGMYRNRDESILLLDHDIFPVNLFPLPDENIILAGIKQTRSASKEFTDKSGNPLTYNYLWAGLLYINTEALSDLEINIRPCVTPTTDVYLDTGGGLYPLVAGNPDRVQFYSEQYEYIDGDDSYSIVDGKWMHFRKGSNWDNNPNYNERIDQLMSILYQNS